MNVMIANFITNNHRNYLVILRVTLINPSKTLNIFVNLVILYLSINYYCIILIFLIDMYAIYIINQLKIIKVFFHKKLSVL